MTTREIAKDIALVKSIQDGLTRHGYLDPNLRGHITKPHDGVFGPATENAMRRFYANMDMMGRTLTDEDVPEGLIQHILSTETIPIDFSMDDNASKIVKAMQAAGHYVSMDKDTVNIVYLEGVNEDFTMNDNALDGWNDLCVLLKMSDEINPRPVILSSYVCTTGPGKYYTDHPMNPMGCARIAFGQYKSWIMGVHKGSQPALQQCQPIQVFRDLNKDGQRTGDRVWVVPCTVNQHGTYPDFNWKFVGKNSAGCLVRKIWGSHLEFLQLLKADIRYAQNRGYIFMSTIMDGNDIFSLK